MGGGHAENTVMPDFRSKQASFLQDLAGVLCTPPPPPRDFELTDECWDSMAMISTIALIDNHFSITIPIEALRSCRSVGQLSDQICRTLGEEPVS